MEISLGTDNIYINIIIPLIIASIGPIFVVIKILYDKWSFKKKETFILNNKLNVERLKKKLELFYWPIYILLIQDYLYFKKTNYEFIGEELNNNFIHSEFKTCCYIKKIKNNKIICCNNYIPKNINDIYCLKHKDENKNIHIKEINLKTNKQINISNIINNKSEKAGNITGHQVGNINFINELNIVNTMENQTNIDNIIQNILKNELKIYDIIIKNISIAEPNSIIGRELIKFIIFYNEFNLNNKKNKINYPKKLLPLIEIELFKLQKKYNRLLKN